MLFVCPLNSVYYISINIVFSSVSPPNPHIFSSQWWRILTSSQRELSVVSGGNHSLQGDVTAMLPQGLESHVGWEQNEGLGSPNFHTNWTTYIRKNL